MLFRSSSIISKINKGDTTVVPDRYFTDVFKRSKEVSERTNGAFDPTVAPLVNAWGFGFTEGIQKVDSIIIDSLLKYVDYRLVDIENDRLVKDTSGLQDINAANMIKLDFNAIAQGYTVDVLAEMLNSKAIENYMIEVGGEVRSKGKNQNDELWRIGIDKPEEGVKDRDIIAIIELNNRSLATSGNYRKFYEKNGVKYSHTIDPKTGYPVRHSLLSATVIASDCITADAYATAFMVMGIDKARVFLQENEDIGLEAYFVYSGPKGEWESYFTAGIGKYLEEDH